ncbi:DNA translocase FtsK [Pseudomonas helleri]|uniref:DNA translocase FtsK n=1 Tax=Pseudomonas helleri TaxID=1608996 RepID=UPI003FD082EF
MKAEHKSIIERAKLLDTQPSVLAHELLVHDLVNAGLFELQNLHSPYGKLNEGQQQEVIDRLSKAATEAVHNAIAIISSRNVETIEVEVVDAKFKKKAITITASIDVNAPDATALAKVPGKMCLLVLAPTDYDEGLDFIKPDRDQKDLPLHVSDLTGSLFNGQSNQSDDLDSEPEFIGDQDPLYAEGIQFVTETRRASISALQRKLKIGYNRAARMLEWMESQGVVTPADSNGVREVLTQRTSSDQPDDDVVDAEFVPDQTQTYGKEFGDYTYEDAAQLIVLKATVFDAAWLQSRLAIDSDQASTLLLRLVDNEVIQLKTEADQSIDNTYKVIASLADLGPNLSVE